MDLRRHCWEHGAYLVVVVQHDLAALYPAAYEALRFGHLGSVCRRRAADPLFPEGGPLLQRVQRVVACATQKSRL